MTRVLLLLALVSMPFTAGIAAEPAASAESVRQLLEATQSRQLLDNARAQVDRSLTAGMQAALGKTEVTPSQRQIVEDMRTRMMALLSEQMTWERFEPMMLQVYTQEFSQREVDGMLAFYRSEVGAAVVAKMPRVVAATMQQTQAMIAGLGPRLQKLMEDMQTALRNDALAHAAAAKP